MKIRFDSITLKEATEKAMAFAKDKRQHYITTPNPEILLEAQKNKKFHKILTQSDMNIPDGIGILWAAKYLDITKKTHSGFIKLIKWLFSLATIPFYPKYIRTVLKERVTGADLTQEICKKSADSPTPPKIFLLGAKKGVAEKTAKILEKKYPGIHIVGTYAGTPKIEDEKRITKMINEKKANILFVAYGAPKQEMWIARNLKKMPTIKLATGIGGTFNFIAGKRKRAPRWMQKMGLEWIYRLIQQPSRIKRMINASVIFPIKIISS